MLDPKKLIDDFLGSRVPGTDSTLRDKAGQVTELARNNPIATTGIVAVLLGTGTGRALAGSALKLGGLAAIAGIAYTAYQNYQHGRTSGDAKGGDAVLPAPEDTSFHPSQAPQGENEFSLTLVRAMIAAARSDGHIDEAERRKIADKLKLSGIGEEAQTFLMEELQKPTDMDALVADAKTDAQKVEFYTASRLAIDPDRTEERQHLADLARRLKLPGGLVEHVEATVSAAEA